MDNYWSRLVQTSEELYRSRALRFHEGNKGLWLSALGIRDGMDVLELGCGGGIFCHRVKQYVPSAQVTGLDFDQGHIAYARQKTAGLGLDCQFVCGDALHTPFGDESFDVCFSHTVAEHVEPGAFLREQYRLLRPGGRVVLLSARTGLTINGEGWQASEGEEQALVDKAWQGAEQSGALREVGQYARKDAEFPALLEKQGFHQIDLQYFMVTSYAPDNASTPDELAREQIETNRLHTLCSLQKALQAAPDALTPAERERAEALINQRYDDRLAAYRRGEKQWDLTVNCVLAAIGIR